MTKVKMKVFKRNAIILTVVMFLCVAVYLNWSYAKNENKAASGIGDGTDEAVIDEQGSADEASMYYEPNDDVENAGDSAETISADSVSDYFATAKLNREQARDSAIDVLKESTQLENATQESIDNAMTEIDAMAGYSMDEAEIETMIKAKGFDECVVFLDDDSATIAVSAPQEGLSESAVSRITDIMLSETSLSAEQIKIIEVK